MGLFTRQPAPEIVPEPEPVDDLLVGAIVDLQAEPEPDPRPEGVYTGRLVCDGDGNLLAFEGDWAGRPVYHNLESAAYLYVNEDGHSHNERHHTSFTQIESTTPNDPHHIDPTDGDDHYDVTAPNKTRLRYIPDAYAPKATGHTEAYL